MTDLVERLRDWPCIYPEDQDKPEGHLYEVAADRIEALEAENQRLREVLEQSLDSLTFAQAELQAQAHIPAADAKILQGRIGLVRDVLAKSSTSEGEE